jgi:hypothetical protein
MSPVAYSRAHTFYCKRQHMKPFLKPLFILLLIITAISCRKDDGNLENPNEQGLTSCPANSNCEYLYTANADFSNLYGTVAQGNYRIFSTEIKTSYRSSIVYIKTPMKGDAFYLDNSDIQKSMVKFENNCPACLSATLSYKVTGGYSKGKKLNPIDPTASEKWLVETKLFIDIANTVYKDTLYVKQYYYPRH